MAVLLVERREEKGRELLTIVVQQVRRSALTYLLSIIPRRWTATGGMVVAGPTLLRFLRGNRGSIRKLDIIRYQNL